MKKLLGLLILAASFSAFMGCASNNVGFVPNRFEKNVTLPDGSKGDVFFSQKWSGELGKYANDKSQWQGKHSVLEKNDTESKLGYGAVWHNADENAAIQNLCKIMEESGFKYGVAYVNHGKRIRRHVMMYKKGRLKNSFMDFFAENHEFYIAHINKEAEKKKKQDEKIDKVTKTILSPLTPSSSVSSRESFAQELYRLRHETQEISRIGGHGDIKTFRWRYIYRDDGRMINEYIVDLDGNIRSNIARIGRDHDFNEMYPLVQYYSVPKEIRELAMKSLE